MAFYTVEDVRRAAVSCTHDFACLRTGVCARPEQCPVAYAAGENTLVLDTGIPNTCPHRTAHGDTQLCRCPTHCAVYRFLGKARQDYRAYMAGTPKKGGAMNRRLDRYATSGTKLE